MTVQVCENGHLTNHDPVHHPEENTKYCSKCGAPSLLNCPKCQAAIDDEGYMIFIAPNYCKNCGQPFPWTESRLKAAHELVQSQDNLSEDDRRTFDNSIDDLVRDTPSATVAANRVKIILGKAGNVAAGMFRDILVDIMSETAKKIIFPNQ